MDSIRPSKTNRNAPRNISSMRAAYKPLDISNEAMDAVFLQLQKDRKLGPAFVRTQWPAVDKFLACNGHLTMLELCQVIALCSALTFCSFCGHSMHLIFLCSLYSGPTG